MRLAARSHSRPHSSGLELRRFSMRWPRESRTMPGETSYGGPPTGTTLHIKRPRERRTALSNHCHRRRRRRHSFRFNFFSLAPYSFLFFLLDRARSPFIRLSSSIHLRSCDLSSPFFTVPSSASSFVLHLSAFLPSLCSFISRSNLPVPSPSRIFICISRRIFY